jgi:squalene synthase HpnC
MGVGHYENFPVASLLAPPSLRPAIRAIYRFARTADDVADEGNAPASQRLEALAALHAALDAIERGDAGDWADLAQAVREHHLPLSCFHELLSAFEQDVTTLRYRNFDDLLDYCRRSANPVGRLLLALYRRSDAQAAAWSDAICTALQLANFWQDVALDWDKGRVYIPMEDLRRVGVEERDIAARSADARWIALMRFETERTRELMLAGAPLAYALPGRIGLELRFVVQGGLRILERIDAVSGDVFRHRPTLGLYDWLLIGVRGLRRLPQAVRRAESPSVGA